MHLTIRVLLAFVIFTQCYNTFELNESSSRMLNFKSSQSHIAYLEEEYTFEFDILPKYERNLHKVEAFVVFDDRTVTKLVSKIFSGQPGTTFFNSLLFDQIDITKNQLKFRPLMIISSFRIKINIYTIEGKKEKITAFKPHTSNPITVKQHETLECGAISYNDTTWLFRCTTRKECSANSKSTTNAPIEREQYEDGPVSHFNFLVRDVGHVIPVVTIYSTCDSGATAVQIIDMNKHLEGRTHLESSDLDTYFKQAQVRLFDQIENYYLELTVNNNHVIHNLKMDSMQTFDLPVNSTVTLDIISDFDIVEMSDLSLYIKDTETGSIEEMHSNLLTCSDKQYVLVVRDLPSSEEDELSFILNCLDLSAETTLEATQSNSNDEYSTPQYEKIIKPKYIAPISILILFTLAIPVFVICIKKRVQRFRSHF